MEHYWSLIQGRVCRKCIDGDGRGNCRLPAEQVCRLRESLPQIVRTVRSVESDSYEEYFQALRANVCAQCPDQWSDGICEKRGALECALDRYYVLVLDVIDDVRAGMEGISEPTT